MLKGLVGIALVVGFWNYYNESVDTSSPEAFANTIVATAPAVKAKAEADFEANALPKIQEAVKDFDQSFKADIARASANFNRAEQAKSVESVEAKPTYYLSSNPNTTFKYCYHLEGGMSACYGEPRAEM